jgi:hypothetical protein
MRFLLLAPVLLSSTAWEPLPQCYGRLANHTLLTYGIYPSSLLSHASCKPYNAHGGPTLQLWQLQCFHTSFLLQTLQCSWRTHTPTLATLMLSHVLHNPYISQYGSLSTPAILNTFTCIPHLQCGHTHACGGRLQFHAWQPSALTVGEGQGGALSSGE